MYVEYEQKHVTNDTLGSWVVIFVGSVSVVHWPEGCWHFCGLVGAVTSGANKLRE